MFPVTRILISLQSIFDERTDTRRQRAVCTPNARTKPGPSWVTLLRSLKSSHLLFCCPGEIRFPGSLAGSESTPYPVDLDSIAISIGNVVRQVALDSVEQPSIVGSRQLKPAAGSCYADVGAGPFGGRAADDRHVTVCNDPRYAEDLSRFRDKM